MIIPNQENLKVHFAGCETLPHFLCVNAAKVNYSLFTVYPFIVNKIGSKNTTISEVPKIIDKHSKHTIMDSGLFTLMFGAAKGKKDKKFLFEWVNLIIEFIKVNNFKGTYVEVDCQKILGVDAAWEFREYMKENLPNRQINVFHYEDGKDGLDRMIEYSDYIALSIPELRIIKKKEYVYQLANYIKNKKPEIDIHLLGCTEMKLLRDCNFCSTSDSTSWLTPVRYGVLDSLGDKKLMKNLNNEEIISKYKNKINNFVTKYNLNLTEKAQLNYSVLIHQCEILKIKYAKLAGSQS
jgi:hypothetical protein